MFDSIYERLSTNSSTSRNSRFKKPQMSVSMDVKFHIKDEATANNISNNQYLYALVSKLMEHENLDEKQFTAVYNNFEYSEDENNPVFAGYNLSGVGYMRQNYTLDLNPESTVSDLISNVFESYNLCNNVMNYIERNLNLFNTLMLHKPSKKSMYSDETPSKIAGDILSLYNSERDLITQKFREMKFLIKKLVSIFGMESVIGSTVNTLSGGFKMRLYLFILLLHSPSLLLLDEPTNNLDTTTVKFLIDVLKYLMKNSTLSVLVVSHDTVLLNTICTSILQMPGDGTIAPFKGNFDDFVQKGTNEKNMKNARIEKLRKNINVLTRDIQELKKSKKGSLSALRVTISQKQDLLDEYQEELDELIGTPISKYTKTYNRVLFKINDDHRSKSNENVNYETTFNMIFQKILRKNPLLNTGQMLNSFGPLFKLINITLDTHTGKRIFDNLNLTIHPSDRIVLLGENGIGKTTLLKLLFKSQATFRNNPLLAQISSIEKKLLYQSITDYLDVVNRGMDMEMGRMDRDWKLFEEINKVNREMTNSEESVYDADDIEYRILVNEPFNFTLVDGLMSVNDAKLSYYSQNCSNILNYNKTVYNLLRDYVGNEVEQDALAEYLGCFHLADYANSSVSTLSFGERSRLLLSLLLINKAHFLLMDEPTNHLDLFMKKLMKLIVNGIYKGGFMIATHDLDFIKDLNTVNSFIYIYSKDKVFRFNDKFGPEYIAFKSEYSDATRSQVLDFLTQFAGDKKYCKIAINPFIEEQDKHKKGSRGKKKVHPPRSPNDRSRFKNIKRWK
ncbi:ABC transporter family protein [Theileria parva strain Muguga]|uniref:ABC transporter family protein n=1 Tax=Theileria parva strain Muguga TaxID=333668 RepID=UPI001C620781|nr:ABC transporter family protein [Theileria parva strain Muguga]EAN34199.2 ABC transporter family protein [Theileria parva strain Muguga]